MKLDESSLTGESDHVRKSADKDPMLLSGKPRPPHKHGWCHDDHFGPEQTKTGCVTVNYRPDNPIYLLYLKFEFSSAVQSFSLSLVCFTYVGCFGKSYIVHDYRLSQCTILIRLVQNSELN